MADPKRRWRILRFALGLVVLAAAIALLVSGVFEDLSAESVRSWLTNSGPWGPVLFLVSFALLQPFGFAAHVFIIGASLVWPAPIAFGLSWVGTVAAGCAAFGFARFMGRDWVRERLPERLRKYDERLESDGFRTVLVLRLLFFTFGPMQFMFGVSRVGFAQFLGGTALGVVPMIALDTLVGASALSAILAW